MKRLIYLSSLFLSTGLFAMAGLAQEASPSPPQPAAAKDEARIQSLENQVRTLVEQVTLLRAEVETLRTVRTPAAPAQAPVLLTSAHLEPGMLPNAPVPSAAPASAPQPVVEAEPPVPAQAAQTGLGGATSNAKLLNPDISLIGDFIGTMGHNPISPSPSLELHESEVGMQAIIDPYARADVFISFGEEGVEVEEGYVTFTSLPAGLLLKVGKMRADFGKVNTIHNHALNYIDRPLATNNLVGGEDGIDDAGLSLSRFIPAPKGWFMEGTRRSSEAIRAMSTPPRAARI